MGNCANANDGGYVWVIMRDHRGCDSRKKFFFFAWKKKLIHKFHYFYIYKHFFNINGISVAKNSILKWKNLCIYEASRFKIIKCPHPHKVASQLILLRFFLVYNGGIIKKCKNKLYTHRLTRCGAKGCAHSVYVNIILSELACGGCERKLHFCRKLRFAVHCNLNVSFHFVYFLFFVLSRKKK